MNVSQRAICPQGVPQQRVTGSYPAVLWLARSPDNAAAIAFTCLGRPALRSYPPPPATSPPPTPPSALSPSTPNEAADGRGRRYGTPPAPPSGHGHYAGCYPTGVKSREAMKGGRGAGAAYGSPRVFSTLLNTTNTFDLGNGVMLLFEPCMQLQSNSVAEPAGPENCSMPCLSANAARLAGSGVPISWFRSDFL